MKILFLAQRIPYPPNRGDKITTWRLAERMQRQHDVQCIAFAHNDDDVESAQELGRRGIPTTPIRYHDRKAKLKSLPLLLTSQPLTLGVYGSKELQAEVDRVISSSDMVYAYSSSMGAFMLPHGNLPRVMHFGELDSDKWRQYVEKTSFPMSWVYKREWKTLYEFEKRVAYAVDQNVFCTPLEEGIFQERIPGAPSTVLRNGVDLEYFSPKPELAEPKHLVFTGVMNYYPNVDGCIHFVNDILPLVRKEFPKARLTIVGAHPTDDVKKLGLVDGVEVTGFVDDIRDYTWRGAISVAPLRIARGIQNKVLEAMAMGLPIVGTTSATQGVGGESGRDFLVAESAEDQAQAICSLLREPIEARALGARARTFVEENYHWEVVFNHLDEILDSCENKEKTTA